MTVNEAKEAIRELQAQGSSEEDIVASFYLMYSDGKINVDQLEALCGLLGYTLSDEFRGMSEEEQKTYALKDGGDEEKPEESNESDEKEEPEEDSEDEKAMKLFGK